MKPLGFFLFFNSLAIAASTTDYTSATVQFREELKKMVEADTTNPPGNEERIVKVVAKRLNKEGIPYEVSEFAPGRQSIVARLKASKTSSEKPILIIAHIDVVGTANQEWTAPKHQLTERDGYLIGRGVADDLGMAAAGIEVLSLLKQSGTPLRRDVILALTADEESGGKGIQYILKHHPEQVDSAIALNEGGGIVLDEQGKPKFISLQIAEKSYQDYALSVKGTTGHSSVPLSDNAIFRLARALNKLGNYAWPVKMNATLKTYLTERAKVESPSEAKAMRELAGVKGKPRQKSLSVLDKDPSMAASLRTTCTATMLEGGTRVNALPAEAKANVNCRIMPEESADEIQSKLMEIVGDSGIEITQVERFGRAAPSPVEGEGPAAIRKVANEMWGNLPIVPTISSWATDSRYLRKHGIAAYGINPIAMTEGDGRRAHGIDERIPVASVPIAIEFLHRLVLELAAMKGAST